jgi:hypothetical protein
LVHPSKLHRFTFELCVTQTPPWYALLVHPLKEVHFGLMLFVVFFALTFFILLKTVTPLSQLLWSPGVRSRA